jgi:tetratricopeptide (TPR) repeat protein
VAFSPDGQRLASASEDKTVKVWDMKTKQELRALAAHTGTVASVVFSPIGPRLASASHDSTVKLWDVETGQLLRSLAGHVAWVTSVAFSPDGQRLVSAGTDGTVRLWDVETGQELRIMTGDSQPMFHGVAFSPDGRRLAAGGDGTVILWDSASARRANKGHSPRWHTQQAEASRKAGRWLEATLHLTWLIRESPTSAELYFNRGYAHAAQSHWREATADYAEASRLEPKNAAHLLFKGLAELGMQDEASYRRTRSRMLQDFDELEVAWLAVLVPMDAKDGVAVVNLAEKAVRRGPEGTGILGAAFYRVSDYAGALKWLNEAIVKDSAFALDEITVQLFLAMTHHHLGHTAEAKQRLKKAVAQIKKAETAEESPSWGEGPPSWGERLIHRLLREEAETLLKLRTQ